jgi:hypothetical protein
VVTLKLDTFYGEIKMRGDIFNSLTCTFKDQTNNIKNYKPFEILSFRFVNGKYYISKSVISNQVAMNLFVEYLVKGEKNLFYYRDYYGNHFLIDYKPDTLIEIPYHEKTMDINDVQYFYTSTIHTGYLKTYFNNCPSVFNEIDQIHKPDFDNLVKLTRDYHHLICKDSSCIVYYKPDRPLKFSIEPVFGFVNDHRMQLGFNNATQTGGMLYLWLPRANENLYFKTGYLVTSSMHEPRCTLYQIPVQLEYIFPYKYIKPKVDFGINNYSINSTTDGQGITMALSISAGVLLTLTKHIYLDVSVNTDLLIPIVDQFLYLSSFSLESGLLFRL